MSVSWLVLTSNEDRWWCESSLKNSLVLKGKVVALLSLTHLCSLPFLSNFRSNRAFRRYSRLPYWPTPHHQPWLNRTSELCCILLIWYDPMIFPIKVGQVRGVIEPLILRSRFQRLYYKWTTFRTSWWSHFQTLEGDCSQKWHIRGSGFDLTFYQYCKPGQYYF